MSILIVDDDQKWAKALARIIEGATRVANTIKEALQAAEEIQPDIIILDVCLGDDCGLDYLKNFAEISPLSRIVVCSSMATRSEAAKINHLGLWYLDKCDAIYLPELIQNLGNRPRFLTPVRGARVLS